jgi:hypothetical protein
MNPGRIMDDEMKINLRQEFIDELGELLKILEKTTLSKANHVDYVRLYKSFFDKWSPKDDNL